MILQFPLWWFGMPAILKGWVDRVFACGLAYGYKGAGNRYRYGEGGFEGKRALLSTTVGGPAEDYSPRGINGPLEQLLFPITHGTLFFSGMHVLPTHAVYDTGRISAEGVAQAKANWRRCLERLFEDAPIAFRPQNGGDYPDRHALDDDVASDRKDCLRIRGGADDFRRLIGGAAMPMGWSHRWGFDPHTVDR